MNPFFSIIIPVYNGLTHDLEICLDSIWKQPIDHTTFEVICVDDCSNDGTREWLLQEQSKHTNLKLIFNPQNIRQGGSRNKGIKSALGSYILFIDQDDYFNKNIFNTIYNHLQHNALDILVCDCSWKIKGGKETSKLQHNFPFTDVMPGDLFIEKNSIPFAPWKYIINRQYIITNNIFFEENERIEDVDWCYKLVHNAQNVQYQPILLIFYIKSDISTTMTAYKTPETIFSTMRMGLRLNKLIETEFRSSSDAVKENLFRTSILFYKIGLRDYFLCNCDISQKVKVINDTLQHPLHLTTKLIFIKKHPYLIAYLSNIIAPICKCLLNIYRKYKYHIAKK